MKKKVLFVGLILFLMLNVSFVIAQNQTTEDQKVGKAYDCLENKTEDRCSSLSTEEKIFTLLAINECESELVSDSSNEECWPSSNCNIKSTAQAVLALSESGSDTDTAENWLISKNTTPTEIVWYLEIESTEATACTISYSGASYNINIGENKKISGGAGGCLSLAQDDYWLRISPTCYNVEFSTSCDKSFLTTLLFQKTTSSTIHVSESTHSASAAGTTQEKVNSYCFATGTTCDYEGSLWAALVLNSLDYDVSSYLPYLIVMTDGNSKYLPESFLYLLTGSDDYKIELLSKQTNNYWEESGNKYYDTALALYPFQYEEPTEKANSKEWLLDEDVQDEDGCWQGGNIRDTAFILYSIWPKIISSPPPGVDCEDAGYYCRARIDCLNDEGGQVLGEYECSGTLSCCNVAEQVLTCAEQQGEICTSGKVCTGTEVEASDAETCCVSGTCEESDFDVNECEENLGVCRTSCEADEDEPFFYECPTSGDACCFPKQEEAGSYWWIWILVILIVLVIIGIIFRDKLRMFLFRIKPGRAKPSPPRGPPPRGFPSAPAPPRMIMPRRPMFSPRQAPLRKPSEVDEVLRKLKEMGK